MDTRMRDDFDRRLDDESRSPWDKEMMLRRRVDKLTIHALNQAAELRRLNKSMQRKVHVIKRLREGQRDQPTTTRFLPLPKFKGPFKFKDHGSRREPVTTLGKILNPASTKAEA